MHAPDPAAFLVPVGMVPRDLIVGNDLVIPIDEVEAAVRPQPQGHRTEHLVAGLNEIRQLVQRVTRPVEPSLDGLDLPRDGIGDVDDVAVSLGP